MNLPHMLTSNNSYKNISKHYLKCLVLTFNLRMKIIKFVGIGLLVVKKILRGWLKVSGRWRGKWRLFRGGLRL